MSGAAADHAARDRVAARVNGIVRELAMGADSVEPGDRLREDLGFDELDLVELTLDVEAAFDIEISDEDAEEWDTPQDIADYVAARTAEAVA